MNFLQRRQQVNVQPGLLPGAFQCARVSFKSWGGGGGEWMAIFEKLSTSLLSTLKPEVQENSQVRKTGVDAVHGSCPQRSNM